VALVLWTLIKFAVLDFSLLLVMVVVEDCEEPMWER
jgi:hypothetical protein